MTRGEPVQPAENSASPARKRSTRSQSDAIDRERTSGQKMRTTVASLDRCSNLHKLRRNVIQVARRRSLPAASFTMEERTRDVDISNLDHFRSDGVYRPSRRVADRYSGPGPSVRAA